MKVKTNGKELDLNFYSYYKPATLLLKIPVNDLTIEDIESIFEDNKSAIEIIKDDGSVEETYSGFSKLNVVSKEYIDSDTAEKQFNITLTQKPIANRVSDMELAITALQEALCDVYESILSLEGDSTDTTISDGSETNSDTADTDTIATDTVTDTEA